MTTGVDFYENPDVETGKALVGALWDAFGGRIMRKFLPKKVTQKLGVTDDKKEKKPPKKTPKKKEKGLGEKTFVPGPFSKDKKTGKPLYEPIKGTKSRVWTSEQKKKINELGEKFGCHSCGSRASGRKNWIPDHQPPIALDPNRANYDLYPHCKKCAGSQGGTLGQRNRK